MITLDARGISCPEPLIMLKRALKTERELLMVVDNKAALANCKGFAKKEGFTVAEKINGDTFEMRIRAK